METREQSQGRRVRLGRVSATFELSLVNSGVRYQQTTRALLSLHTVLAFVHIIDLPQIISLPSKTLSVTE